jgi:CelD/BcsL family acetyltransferase involved in cellulose biosynthesis
MIEEMNITDQSIDGIDEAIVRSPAPRDGAGTDRLAVEVVDTPERLASLRGEWEELVSAGTGDIFQSFDWVSLWWKHYGVHPDRRLHVLVFRADGVLAGIAPLFIEQDRFAGFAFRTRLRMIGCGVGRNGSSDLLSQFGVSDYLDVIARPDFENRVVDSFLGYLETHPEACDECELEHIPERSILNKLMLPRLKSGVLPHEANTTDICPRASLPATIGEYLSKRKPEVRTRINQARKAANKLYTIKAVDTEEELNRAFECLVGLHQKRWNELGYPGLFADSRFRKFQEEVIPSFFERGWIWCKTAETEDGCIAVRLGFAYRDTFYDFLSGFDHASPAARKRPGIALLYSMILDAMSTGGRTLDLLRGDERYKFDFADGATQNSRIVIFSRLKTPAARAMLIRCILKLRMASSLARKEWSLFKVQYGAHGLIKSAPRYLSFRVRCLTDKLSDKG